MFRHLHVVFCTSKFLLFCKCLLILCLKHLLSHLGRFSGWVDGDRSHVTDGSLNLCDSDTVGDSCDLSDTVGDSCDLPAELMSNSDSDNPPSDLCTDDEDSVCDINRSRQRHPRPRGRFTNISPSRRSKRN